MPTVQGVTWDRAKASVSILAIGISISLFTFAYEKAVNPLFGGVATAHHMNYVVHGSTALGIILPKLPRSLLLLFLATLTQLAPHTSYWVSVFAARNGDPIVGPLITHAAVLAPVIYLAISLAASIDFILATMVLAINALQLRPLILLAFHRLSFNVHKDVVFLVLGSLVSFVWISEKLGASRPSNDRISGSNAITSITKQFWAVLIPTFAFLFLALYSPALAGSNTFPYESKVGPLRILSSKDSITGVVVVGELLPREDVAGPNDLHSIRYLRASHSLLGGVWIGSSVASLDSAPFRTDLVGTPLGDSIFSTFVLQEAVRLASKNLRADKSQRENALIIGLGTGISADAFIRHGISTTIVEIDPAVYDAARMYFGLEYPGDDRVFLEDARNWVHKRRGIMESDDKKSHPDFDFVVHDCFSGGGVPQHLFSMEFWNDLKTIMKPDGVVAVNFAGRFGSRSTRAIATTLQRAFARCRIFHDLLAPIPEDRPYSDFLNMVFFCSPSPSPINFRRAVDADYLHSPLRRYVLSDLDKGEVSISQLKGEDVWSKDSEEHFVLTDMNNTLNAWQSEEALEHWRLMRKILPALLWETY